MGYIDVLPLSEATDYLRIDDAQNETDIEITSMIKAAFKFIERNTNILVVNQQAKEYIITGGCVRVYDYPINSVVKGIDDDGEDVALVYKTDYDRNINHGYTEYVEIDSDAEKLVLNVGYTEPSDVPEDIVQIAKELIKTMYYEQETNQTIDDMLSPQSRQSLEQMKRFIV